MGTISNKLIEDSYFDREESPSHKKIPKYEKDYNDLRKKYRIVTPNKNTEPKSSSHDNIKEDDDLER